MTLAEAIKHTEEKSKDGSECAAQHKQLHDWLTELRDRRDRGAMLWDFRYFLEAMRDLIRVPEAAIAVVLTPEGLMMQVSCHNSPDPRLKGVVSLIGFDGDDFQKPVGDLVLTTGMWLYNNKISPHLVPNKSDVQPTLKEPSDDTQD